MYNSNVHIITITDSWLNDGITGGLLDPQGLFNVFRSDRRHVCVLVSNCLPVIAIHSNLLSDFIADTNTVVCNDRVYRPDIVCIELVSLFRIIAVYRPPSDNTAPLALTHKLTDIPYSLFSLLLWVTLIVQTSNGLIFKHHQTIFKTIYFNSLYLTVSPNTSLNQLI